MFLRNAHREAGTRIAVRFHPGPAGSPKSLANSMAALGHAASKAQYKALSLLTATNARGRSWNISNSKDWVSCLADSNEIVAHCLVQ